jgi:hypothetical protein
VFIFGRAHEICSETFSGTPASVWWFGGAVRLQMKLYAIFPFQRTFKSATFPEIKMIFSNHIFSEVSLSQYFIAAR